MSHNLDEINALLAAAAEQPTIDAPEYKPTPTTPAPRVVNLCHEELAAANSVLDDLSAAGVAVEAVDGRLRLSPRSAVDAALQARVAALKPAILSLLATRPDAATLWRQAIERVAESLKLPPEVLEAAKAARVRWAPAARLKDR